MKKLPLHMSLQSFQRLFLNHLIILDPKFIVFLDLVHLSLIPLLTDTLKQLRVNINMQEINQIIIKHK